MNSFWFIFSFRDSDSLFNSRSVYEMLASGNFKLVASTYFITRENLIVELNTDPRIPPEVIKPTSKVTNKSNYMTTGNEKSPNKNITTNKNSVSRLHVMHV